MAKATNSVLGVGGRIFAVLSCAFLCGFIGTVSFSAGFGGVFSALVLSLSLTLFVFAFFGERRRMSYEAIPVAVILASASVIFDSGIGSGCLPTQNALLGFGLFPLFTLCLASRFSKKPFGLKRLFICIAAYLAVLALFKVLTLPAVIDKLGISAIRSIPDLTLYGAARAAAALVCSLTALIAFRDKVTGLLSLAFNLVFAASITCFGIFENPTVIFSSAAVIEIMPTLSKFCGGFVSGFLIMLLIVCLPASITGSEGRFTCEEPFKSRKFHCFYSALLTFTFTFVFTLACPLAARLSGHFGVIGTYAFFAPAVTGGVCLIFFIIFLVIFRKNIVSRGMPVPLARRADKFCASALPVYSFALGLIHFFTADAPALKFNYGEIISSPTYENTLGSSEFVFLFTSAVAFVLFYVFYAAARACVRKK